MCEGPPTAAGAQLVEWAVCGSFVSAQDVATLCGTRKTPSGMKNTSMPRIASALPPHKAGSGPAQSSSAIAGPADRSRPTAVTVMMALLYMVAPRYGVN
ncbi:hypothetical protein GCM10020216_098750 [Nonomuraea helvata]